MKELNNFIQEKLIISKNIKILKLFTDKCDKIIYSEKDFEDYYPKVFNKETLDKMLKYVTDYPLYIWVIDVKTNNNIKLGDYQKEFHDRYKIDLKETVDSIDTEYAIASVTKTNKNNYYEILVMPKWGKFEEGDELKTKLFFIFQKYKYNK